jgi:hypothetical protein
VIALGCLDGRDERGEGQGSYSSRLGLEPGVDTTTRDSSEMKQVPQQLCSVKLSTMEQGEDYCLDWGSSQA